MSNLNQYPSQPVDDYSTPLFGKPIKAPKDDKTARTFTSLLIKGLLVNSIVSAITTAILAFPIFALAILGIVTFGPFGLIFLLGFILIAVGLVGVGFIWSAGNVALMYFILTLIKNKVISALVSPIIIGVLVFLVRFSGVSFDNPYIYVVYGLIGVNIVTSIVLNLRSQIPIPEKLFKSANSISKVENTTDVTLPSSFTQHESDS